VLARAKTCAVVGLDGFVVEAEIGLPHVAEALQYRPTTLG